MLKRLFVSNSEYLPYLQALFLTSVVVVPFFHSAPWYWWLVPVGVYFVTGCLGISIAYHRLLTHRSFRTYKWVEYLFSLFGALGCTGSTIGWVGVHHQHHNESDKPRDPHSPRHQGWKVLVPYYEFEVNKWAIRHLLTDPFHRCLHRYYFLIVLIWAGTLLVISFNAFFFGFVVASTIHIFVSTISNYTNHKWGYRNFALPDDSTNFIPTGYLTFGEGWHNNHHSRPRSWNNQVKWWELDLSALIIRLVKI